MNKLSRLRLITGFIFVLALGVGALWLLVPAPSGADAAEFYSPVGTPTTLVDLTVAVGGGIMFLVALRNFKRELKPAYRFLAIAQMSVGIATLVFPYIEYYGLWDNNWWNMSSYLAYLVGSVFMYFGTRQFLKILNIRIRLTALIVVLPLTLVAWIIHTIAPHVDVWTTLNEHQYDAFELVVIIPVLFYAAAAYNALRISRTIGSEYRKAFIWLTAGLTLQLISSVTILVMDIISYDNWYFNTRLYEIPTIGGDLLIMVSAYYFNAVGLAAPAGPGLFKRLLGGRATPANSLEIISFVTGMVSNPAAIDPALDRLRILTSKLGPSQTLSAGDQATLRNVYLEIEQYLTTHEPLRTYTREEVRGRVVQHFGLTNETDAKTFWPAVTAS